MFWLQFLRWTQGGRIRKRWQCIQFKKERCKTVFYERWWTLQIFENFNDKEKVKKALEVFVDIVNFDPAGFKGAIRNVKKQNLKEFKKL